MADLSLSDRARMINHSVKQSTLDELNEHIAKVSAMVQITLCNDFWTFEHHFSR